MSLRFKNKSLCFSKFSLWMLLLVLTVVLSGFASVAQAQLTRSSRIELNDKQDKFYVGPQSYLTFDPEKRLTHEVIVNRHQNNLRGARQNKRVIDFGLKETPVWFLFSVSNFSNSDHWVLHFGRLIDGRSALAKKIVMRNHTTGEVLIDTQNDAASASNNIFGPAIPLTIEKGKTELFTIYIEPKNGLPNVTIPFLIRETDYLQTLNRGDIFSSVVYLFLIGMIGGFVAMALMRKNANYLSFSAFYLTHLILLMFLDKTFFTPLPFLGEGLVFLYMLSVALAIYITRFFLRITMETDNTANTMLIGCGFFIGVTCLLSMLTFKSSSYDDLIVFVSSGVVFLTLIVLSFIKGQKGEYAGIFLAASWLIMFIGGTVTMMAVLHLIPANGFVLNAFMFSLLPQAFFFMLAINKRIQLQHEERLHQRSREQREAQSRVRLKYSKESADQARLLRVIERERELMAELREREMKRTEDMRIAKEIADEANRAKSAFLAVVSHEIRTPMTGILGMVRLIADTKLNTEQKNYMLAIQKSGETMMALLNDILDFEKIETGSMELEEIDFDLPKLVEGIVTLMSGHAAGKEITLKADIPNDIPSYIIGDPTRLRQVLLNLVNNAIKFTEVGGVTIHLKATPVVENKEMLKADYELYIGVEDTGIGISTEAQQNLFNPFEQADKTISRKYGGTGLGLTICKRLIEAMGGAISVKSTEGKGSTFYFSILVREGQAEAADSIENNKIASAPRQDIPAMRVLVVEDNEMNRKVMQGFLEKLGHKPTLSESGEEAVEKLGSQDFDIIFMDINLSGMDGFETISKIRDIPNDNIARIPVVALSGNVSAEDVQRYKQAGFKGFLPKPVTPESLQELLKKMHDSHKNKKPEDKNPAPQTDEAPIVTHARQTEVKNTPESEPQPQPQPKKATIIPASPPATPGIGHDSEDEDDFDSFAEAEKLFEEKAEHCPPLDTSMLEGLYNNLNKESFSGLIDGYLEKANEIIDELMAMKDGASADDIRAKGHELKGMAANFGFKETSEIAKLIEKAGQVGDLQTAHNHIEELPEANQRAQAAIQEWVSSKA